MSRAPLAGDSSSQKVQQLIEEWTREAPSTSLLGVEHNPQPDERGHWHWLIRLRGSDRPVITVWLSLRQRTLHVEVELIGAPERDLEAVYERCLRRNYSMREMSLAIGPEKGIYLVTQIPVAEFDADRFDEVVGASCFYVDELYSGLMTLGFAWYRPRTST